MDCNPIAEGKSVKSGGSRRHVGELVVRRLSRKREVVAARSPTYHVCSPSFRITMRCESLVHSSKTLLHSLNTQNQFQTRQNVRSRIPLQPKQNFQFQGTGRSWSSQVSTRAIGCTSSEVLLEMPQDVVVVAFYYESFDTG